ncbi:MAG: M14 family metallocarboxypeptidase [Methylacidiphilales bacterium]|nr:M14 family metallocarboxypeptidase [Candidatus Methylacidiphilales bacterium]
MSSTFDPSSYARDVEESAQAGGWTIRHLSPTANGIRPWLQRAARTGAGAPSLYLSSGIHGDELSGPLAVLEMLHRPDFFAAFDVVIFPILNPDGLALGVRGNADGIDLNRDYLNSKSAETTSHIEALKTLPRFDAAMMLHEDFEGIGAYLYELNDALAPTLGGEIIAAMGRHVPIDLRPEIEEVRAVGGVIQRRDIVLKLGSIEERTDWPEAIYLSVHHTRVAYTTETPKPFPLEQRVQAQIAAVETLMHALHLKTPGY